MNTTTGKRSPLHSWHETHCDSWCQLGDTLLPHHFAAPVEERAAITQLALCDMSGLALLEVKGPAAVGWLEARDLPVPRAIYEGELTGQNDWITRCGNDEFLLRGAPGNRLSQLAADIPRSGARHDLLITTRQDAVFLLAGRRSGELLAQTCALDHAVLTPGRTVFTRVAAVSCGLLKDQLDDNPVCWLWLDPGHALYLWQQLVQILRDLDGRVVGVCCFYPAVH